MCLTKTKWGYCIGLKIILPLHLLPLGACAGDIKTSNKCDGLDYVIIGLPKVTNLAIFCSIFIPIKYLHQWQNKINEGNEWAICA